MAEYIEKNVAIARLTALEIGNPCATMTDAKRQIADTRPADVAPVVHGRLIDGDKPLTHIKDLPTWWADDGGVYGKSMKYPDGMFDCEDVVNSIENAPTVDAVVVTRCKDCKYADTKKESVVEKRYVADILICRNSNLCGDELLAMWPDDFCSYGEPKEG